MTAAQASVDKARERGGTHGGGSAPRTFNGAGLVPTRPQEFDHVETVAQVQLLQNQVDVVLHGLGLKVEPLGNLFIAQPLGQQSQDLLLALRTPVIPC